MKRVSIPLRGKGKGKKDSRFTQLAELSYVSIPLRGKGKGKTFEVKRMVVRTHCFHPLTGKG